MSDSRSKQTATQPDEFDRDLHPQGREAGQNRGTIDRNERGVRTAYDVKPVHRMLREMQDDDLKQVAILEPGTRLQQGASYVVLEGDSGREITADFGDMTVPEGVYYVSKTDTPYTIYNRLRGIQNPERTT